MPISLPNLTYHSSGLTFSQPLNLYVSAHKTSVRRLASADFYNGKPIRI